MTEFFTPGSSDSSAEESSSISYDIAIIGAGPAGMSAAITASRASVSVVVLDDKPRSGGQIYRNVDASPLPDAEVLGPDYIKGAELTTRFRRCNAHHIRGVTVWHVGDNGEILFSDNGTTKRLTARQIIVATGAMERPFPIPGWHLPGVMSAGSAQVMLKSDGLVRDEAIFAGTGPLLYLIVAQYLRLGGKVKALIDTTPKQNYLHSMTELSGAMRAPGMLIKGVGLLNEIRKSGTKIVSFAEDLKILGEEQAEGLSYTRGGKEYSLPASHIFLHQGVIPNLNMTQALGLEHDWCKQQLCWKPKLNRWGQSSKSHIAVAGDSGGIIGADSAAAMGRIVALNQLVNLGVISALEGESEAADDLTFVASQQRFRRFIDRLYRPLDQQRIPESPGTVVCRCEERTVADLKKGFELGGREPNQLKSQTRCGMGPCQGRMCGHTVSELLANWRNQPVADVGYYRLRSPMRLVTLAELSQFTDVTPKAKKTEEVN
ncbi:FAD-dependent oxidoreductase [Amphritea balenae]|uniref:FAD-binding protein n=1 Tax=Amphritea balenae TaxID=452629 RepID=A0A3P1SS43_9GAMM|nr:FAD-dependent oxidoreductase [Amphritea balenae]RRC99998.1 FAD-binding protein [Amphritea balenae]GGK75753.1 pyridine nucleotide-disulfide oxidoreductase [Amphritea balenae]